MIEIIDAERGDIPEDASDEEIIDALRKSIEAFSDGRIMWSRSALTARNSQHTVFVNGAIKAELEPAIFPTENLQELAERQLIAIQAHRYTIDGPVDLVWRCEPEVQIIDGGKVSLYTRLCFEPSITQVARGVWVENRLV